MFAKNWSILYSLSSLIFIIEALVQTDYCKLDCGEGREHIGCHHTEKFGPHCTDRAKISLLHAQRGLILSIHNEERNRIAGGWEKFRPAKRMAVMRWNAELAYLAQLNLYKCSMGLDKCRRTKKFRYSGQNIGQFGFTNPLKKHMKIKTIIKYWINEYADVTPAILNEFPNKIDDPLVGHFTAIIAEKNTALGCAAIQFPAENLTNFIMTCNYATTNIVGQPVYTIGSRAAIGCKNGPSQHYPNLCSVYEEYDNGDDDDEGETETETETETDDWNF